MQVAGIITTTTDDMSRLSLLFWLSQLASTVDAAQIEDGTPMTVGRVRVSVLIDQYVEAEFASHEDYEKAKENNVQIVRIGERWKRRKELGEQKSPWAFFPLMILSLFLV